MHEGQLFEWLNQLLNLLTALGLVLLAVSSDVLWRWRRPVGKLGAPSAPQLPMGRAVVVGLVVLLSLLFGSSMLVVFANERLLFSRLPAIRVRLGFRSRASTKRY